MLSFSTSTCERLLCAFPWPPDGPADAPGGRCRLLGASGKSPPALADVRPIAVHGDVAATFVSAIGGATATAARSPPQCLSAGDVAATVAAAHGWVLSQRQSAGSLGLGGGGSGQQDTTTSAGGSGATGTSHAHILVWIGIAGSENQAAAGSLSPAIQSVSGAAASGLATSLESGRESLGYKRK